MGHSKGGPTSRCSVRSMRQGGCRMGGDMRVLICGPRDCQSRAAVSAELAALFLMQKPSLVIHGAASGVDSLADQWACASGIKRLPFPAEWNKHGKAAGPIRNQEMLDEGKPDLVIAFQYKGRE